MQRRYYYKEAPRKKGKRNNLKYFGVLNVILGFILFLYFFFPSLSLGIFASQADEIESPVPVYVQNSTVLLDSSLPGELIGKNWYGNANKEKPRVTSYSISIPSLGIDNAVVSTTDYDLASHLVQYLGTPIPVEKGTSIIYGHSSLPQFFDSKNYKTIFSTLHQIKKGEKVLLNINGIVYKYKVTSIEVKSPDDPAIYTQSKDDSYLELVTCSPPGTTWKRLLVKAVLDSL